MFTSQNAHPTDTQYRKMLKDVRDGLKTYWREMPHNDSKRKEYLCRCGRFVWEFAKITHEKNCTWVSGPEMFLGSDTVPEPEKVWWSK